MGTTTKLRWKNGRAKAGRFFELRVAPLKPDKPNGIQIGLVESSQDTWGEKWNPFCENFITAKAAELAAEKALYDIGVGIMEAFGGADRKSAEELAGQIASDFAGKDGCGCGQCKAARRHMRKHIANLLRSHLLSVPSQPTMAPSDQKTLRPHKWDGRPSPEGISTCLLCGCSMNEPDAGRDCPSSYYDQNPTISRTDFLLLIMAVKEHLEWNTPGTYKYTKKVFDGLVEKYQIKGV